MALSLVNTAIPDLGELRKIKDRYLKIPIDRDNPLFDEPVVSLWDYGINGSSYYSGPNKATGEPLPGVNPEPLVRRSVAEKLVIVKDMLYKDDELTNHLDGHAELRIKDALRSLRLQRQLFEVVFPKFLMDANPDWDEKRLKIELQNFVGKPNDDPNSPAPHMTGGAVDVGIVREDGSSIDFGHIRGNMLASQTDFHEGRNVTAEIPANPFARVVRRALYWNMLSQGFVNHPFEFWHYSYGDQMWALFSNSPSAIYGGVVGSPDLNT